MKTIYKYKLDTAFLAPTVRHMVPMHQGAEILHIALDYDGSLAVWAFVESDNEMEKREFYSFWTGNQMPSVPMKHLTTILSPIGIVLHLFEPIPVETVY